jgi:prepilin-type N-terminal cleavage/methylation domain-containing protein
MIGARVHRGFTLVEMMVASVIAIILVNAGAQFAAAMATNVKRAEEQGDLGARQAIAHAFIADVLSGAAYNWNTPRAVGSNDSGSFGEGGCALSSGFCTSSGEIKPPLQICSSPTVDRNVCNAPTATTADALWTYVPRDNVIEAVSILDRNGTPLTNNCDAANVPAATTFDVRGVTSAAWAVDDLVLVSRRGHTTIGTVRAAFGTDANPNNTRQLTIDVGTGATLAFDDGTAGTCDATISLKGARVMRVTQVVLKQDAATRKLLYGHRNAGSAALTYDPIVSGVDDLQLQLDVVHVPQAGSPSVCTSNSSNIFSNVNLTTGACNGEALQPDIAVANVNRVVGLRVGLLFRSTSETQGLNTTTSALFDRTGTTFTDKRLRRAHILYVGLPNAANL